MNKIILIGNLTKDPEVNETKKSIYCKFTVATTRKYVNQDGEKESDFTNVIVWNKLAEICGEYLSKGKKVAVVGELRTRSYEADNGSKKYISEVVADEVEFLTPRNKDEQVNQNSIEEDENEDKLPF